MATETPSSFVLRIQALLTRVGVMTSRPAAFAIVLAYGVAWFVFQRESFDWHAISTLAIWMMTLLIQRAGHRDTQAIHAKLDELLRNDPASRTELEHIDEQQPEEIEQHRNAERTKGYCGPEH